MNIRIKNLAILIGSFAMSVGVGSNAWAGWYVGGGFGMLTALDATNNVKSASVRYRSQEFRAAQHTTRPQRVSRQ
jgi:hypothetical protein